MTKSELLAELSANTYVMIKPSPVDGIGVFAITRIHKGCRDMFSRPSALEDWIPVSRTEVQNLPPHSRRLIETYCLYDDESYFVPEYGFKKMDLVNFLNHSDSPNVISINDGEYFEAIRDIEAGEELLIDYGALVSPD